MAQCGRRIPRNYNAGTARRLPTTIQSWRGRKGLRRDPREGGYVPALIRGNCSRGEDDKGSSQTMLFDAGYAPSCERTKGMRSSFSRSENYDLFGLVSA